MPAVALALLGLALAACAPKGEALYQRAQASLGAVHRGFAQALAVHRASLEAAPRMRGELLVVLADLALRSRLGKGACQGTLCAVRVIVHLYEQGALSGEAGLREQYAFFRERWRGQHAVLWGEQLAQVELAEAIHCGLHGYERTGQGAERP